MAIKYMHKNKDGFKPNKGCRKMRVYCGFRDKDRCDVYTADLIINPMTLRREFFNHVTLNPRFDLVNHSPDGFDWGYEGSGPAQLALAILADYLKDDLKALALYQKFKREWLAHVKTNRWQITQTELNAILRHLNDECLATVAQALNPLVDRRSGEPSK